MGFADDVVLPRREIVQFTQHGVITDDSNYRTDRLSCLKGDPEDSTEYGMNGSDRSLGFESSHRYKK